MKIETTLFLEDVRFVERVIDNPKNKISHISGIEKILIALEKKWCYRNGMYHIPNCEIVYHLKDYFKHKKTVIINKNQFD